MDFTRKAKFVTNGSNTLITSASAYTGVVSIETVRIAFTYASLNDLYIMEYDIPNAYLKALISDKYWSILGPYFRPEFQGCKAYIVVNFTTLAALDVILGNISMDLWRYLDICRVWRIWIYG